MIIWDGEAEDGGREVHGQETVRSAIYHHGRDLDGLMYTAEEWDTVLDLIPISVEDSPGYRDGGGRAVCLIVKGDRHMETIGMEPTDQPPINIGGKGGIRYVILLGTKKIPY